MMRSSMASAMVVSPIQARQSSIRKLPKNEKNMKLEASISLSRRNEEVKVLGEPD